MRLVAAGLVAVASALVAGAVTGSLPRRWRSAPSRRRDGAARRRTWLRQAGLSVTPARFASACVATGAVALVVVDTISGSVLVALVPAVAVAWLPVVWASRRRAERLRRVQRAWPDGLREIIAATSAGASLTQAIEALATTGPAPLAEAFARFPTLARTLGTVAALDVVKEELADPTTDRVIEVLVLAHEQGGALVKAVLRDLLVGTTRDVKLADELETAGLEMRINARIVVVLPWFVLIALTATDGPFRQFYRGPGGAVVLVVGAVMSALGAVVVSRLARDAPETRVFGAGGDT